MLDEIGAYADSVSFLGRSTALPLLLLTSELGVFGHSRVGGMEGVGFPSLAIFRRD